MVARLDRVVAGSVCVLIVASSILAAAAPALGPDTIQRAKPSVVAVGTFQRTRSPAFNFRGTGFVVGDGTLVATNAHVLPGSLDAEHREMLVIAMPTGGSEAKVQEVKAAAVNRAYDIALLRLSEGRLQPLALGDSSRVREGSNYLFTGYPLGSVLGLFQVTHRAMISALAPIAIPSPDARHLDAATLRRLSAGAYSIFQLDGVAYPGNSGSPLYDPDTGEVIGVINMVFVKGTKEAALTQPSGITYAIPIQALKELLATVK